MISHFGLYEENINYIICYFTFMNLNSYLLMNNQRLKTNLYNYPLHQYNKFKMHIFYLKYLFCNIFNISILNK